MTPFDIANNICASRDDIWDETLQEYYKPFMINRALSYHYDTVMYAQAMNSRSQLSFKQQYDFLRLSIQPKKKRFAKWSKQKDDEKISLITEAFKISPRLAQSYASLLNNDEIEQIKSLLDKGGR